MILHPTNILLSYSILWDCPLPLSVLLQYAPVSPRVYWGNNHEHTDLSSNLPPSQHLRLAGWGQSIVLAASGEQRFQAIQEQATRLFSNRVDLTPQINSGLTPPSQVGPRLIGGFSFRPHTNSARWQAFPDACFILPAVQITQIDCQTWLTVNQLLPAENSQTLADIAVAGLQQTQVSLQKIILMAQHSHENAPFKQAPYTTQSSVLSDADLSLATWRRMVEGAVNCIHQGLFEKVVLARTLQTQLNAPLSITAILQHLEKQYPDCYHFLIEPQPGQIFLGATPELLAEVHQPHFRTAALAGTIARGATPQDDDRLGQALLESAKDRHEHSVVVRALQEKLAPLSSQLETASQPSLRKLHNIQHLETPFRGWLVANRGPLDVIAALHPTPALGGWPAAPAQDYLFAAEPFERGWYAAPIGWLDAQGNGLFAVAIRSGLFSDTQSFYEHTGENQIVCTLFAGAGIMADSDADKEWQETALKFRPLLDAIAASKECTEHTHKSLPLGA